MTERYLCPRCVVQLNRVIDWDWSTNRRIIFWREHQALQRMGAFAYFKRGGLVANIIHHLKYFGQPELGVWIGRLAASELEDSGLFDGIDVLIPIPLTRRRQWHRGFNQAERIAAGIGEKLHIPVDEKVLKRLYNRESQTHFTLQQRLTNARHVFGLRKGAEEKLTGKHVMIIDDVMTTGTTMLGAVEAMEAVSDVKISTFTWSWVHLPDKLITEYAAVPEA